MRVVVVVFATDLQHASPSVPRCGTVRHAADGAIADARATCVMKDRLDVFVP